MNRNKLISNMSRLAVTSHETETETEPTTDNSEQCQLPTQRNNEQIDIDNNQTQTVKQIHNVESMIKAFPDDINTLILSYLIPVGSVLLSLQNNTQRRQASYSNKAQDDIISLSFSDDYRRFAACSFFMTFYWNDVSPPCSDRLVNTETSLIAKTIDLPCLSFPREVKVSPDGLYLFIVSNDLQVYLYARSNQDMSFTRVGFNRQFSSIDRVSFRYGKTRLAWHLNAGKVRFLLAGDNVVYELSLVNFQCIEFLNIFQVPNCNWSTMKGVDGNENAVSVHSADGKYIWSFVRDPSGGIEQSRVKNNVHLFTTMWSHAKSLTKNRLFRDSVKVSNDACFRVDSDAIKFQYCIDDNSFSPS